MALLSFAEFVAELQHSPLLRPEWQTHLAALQVQFTDPIALGEELIKRGLLTPLQADRIVRGLQSELIFGSYHLIERLGEGGAGQVFKAWDTERSRFVALKILRKEVVADEESLRRFHREINVSGRLAPHPNLIRTLDSGQVGETHFLAMEFIDGIDLDQLVKNIGPLPVPQACDLIRQAALGLQHAHEHGLVHRDIKPSNLMVNGPDRKAVKILDLGLARLQTDSGCSRGHTFKTSDGTVTLGTVDYQAPEQALDFHTADIRADIYSLGCTLHFLLTGSPPFGNGSLAVKLMRHQQAEPPDIRELRPDVPPGLPSILNRMLAKEQAQRYATPGEVATALTELNRPPRVRPPWLLLGSLGTMVLGVLLLFAVLPGKDRAMESQKPLPMPKDKPAAAALATRAPEELVLDLGQDISLMLVKIPAGKFMMGSPEHEKDRERNEGPQHEVTITRPFYIGIYPVTQEQYKQVIGRYDRDGVRGPKHPAVGFTWPLAVAFCKTLSEKSGRTVRLPTEAEWEYACRAGTTTRFPYGDDFDYAELGDYAWYEKNANNQIQPVGQKKPNPWGLHDMLGNAYEWCSDFYADSYPNARLFNPTGPESGMQHVVRGSSFLFRGRNPASSCRPASRDKGNRDPSIGFRVIVEIK